MTDDDRIQVGEALAVTVEVCGTVWSLPAIRAVCLQLEAYPAPAVLAALRRCQMEVTGRLSLAAIIERIDDGRPTADEAWAQVGTDDENRTLVSTNEAMAASGELGTLLTDDPVAARMAFKDAYKRIVTENRSRGIAPKYFASMGHDKAGRVAPILHAVERGRLTLEHAQGLLGEQMPTPRALPAGAHVDQLGQQRVSKLLGGLVESLALPGDAPAAFVPPTAEEQEQIRQAIEAAKKACA